MDRLTELGEKERKAIIEDVRKEAKANNTTFGRELARLIFKPDGDKRLRMTAMQLYVRDILPKSQEPNRGPVFTGPVLFSDRAELPEPGETAAPVYLPRQHEQSEPH